MIVLWQEVAKMDDIWLKIKELAAAGNGIVSTKQVEHMGNQPHCAEKICGG